MRAGEAAEYMLTTVELDIGEEVGGGSHLFPVRLSLFRAYILMRAGEAG
jgi:hypothetical protein